MLIRVFLLFLVFRFHLFATYSIVACDPETKDCGVAVQTNNLAVGSSVPAAQAGLGAIASQFETNPAHASRAMTLLAGGLSAKATLDRVLAEDSFEGQGAEARQVGLVSADGGAAAFTGQLAQAASWAGSLTGKGYAIQGNGLAGSNVVQEMERAFLSRKGRLADRLMAALAAADASGGQKSGKESAALLVKTLQGWPIDIDLRVDHAAEPVKDLQALYDLYRCRQGLADARRLASQGATAQARVALLEAGALAESWPRGLIAAALCALQLQEQELALRYLTSAFHQSPAWRDAEIGQGKWAMLGYYPRFRHFVTPIHRKTAVLDFRKLAVSGSGGEIESLRLAQILLEAGEVKLARDALHPYSSSSGASLLLAVADRADGHLMAAIQRCRQAVTRDPNDAALRLYQRRLEREAEGRQRRE